MVDGSQGVDDVPLDFVLDILRVVLHQVGLPGSILILSEAVVLGRQLAELIVAAPLLDSLIEPQRFSDVGTSKLRVDIWYAGILLEHRNRHGRLPSFLISDGGNRREGYNELVFCQNPPARIGLGALEIGPERGIVSWLAVLRRTSYLLA